MYKIFAMFSLLNILLNCGQLLYKVEASIPEFTICKWMEVE
jgi:hypothetical protein